MLVSSDKTVTKKYDLAIEKEDGSEWKDGPNDHLELFLQGDAVMRLYVRDGKLMADEDIADVIEWIYRRYVPEVLLLEELLATEGEPVH